MAIESRYVLYCPKCGMPPEYCSFGPDYSTHCKPWLDKNYPGFLKVEEDATAPAVQETDEAVATESDDQAVVEDDKKTAVAPPLTPWTTRDRLFNFYKKHVPAKVEGDSYGDVDKLLAKYAGKEENLFVALVKKYGDEPVDPYIVAKYGEGSDSEDEDEEGDKDKVVVKKMSGLRVAQQAATEKVEGEGDAADAGGDGEGGKKNKARGVAAKSVVKLDTRVIISKNARNRKKAVTHVVGLNTFDHPSMTMKDMAKAFAKRFAGSSSVKDETVIIQGDHVDEVAKMIVEKFKCKRDCVFIDDGSSIVGI